MAEPARNVQTQTTSQVAPAGGVQNVRVSRSATPDTAERFRNTGTLGSRALRPENRFVNPTDPKTKAKARQLVQRAIAKPAPKGFYKGQVSDAKIKPKKYDERFSRDQQTTGAPETSQTSIKNVRTTTKPGPIPKERDGEEQQEKTQKKERPSPEGAEKQAEQRRVNLERATRERKAIPGNVQTTQGRIPEEFQTQKSVRGRTQAALFDANKRNRQGQELRTGLDPEAESNARERIQNRATQRAAAVAAQKAAAVVPGGAAMSMVGMASGSRVTMSTFSRFVGYGAAWTLYVWVFVFALLSLFALVGDAAVTYFQDSTFLGNITGFFVDLTNLLPIENFGIALWAIASILVATSVAINWIWLHRLGVRPLGSMYGTLTTFFLLAINLMPVLNLFPWFIIWMSYMQFYGPTKDEIERQNGTQSEDDLNILAA